jgi:hypothetical protein
LPPLTVAQIGGASLILLVAGGLAGAALAWRSPLPVTLPLGAGLLVRWLFVNKVYSPQYALWVYVALALRGVAQPIWAAFALFDLAYYYASFQILFTANLDRGGEIGRLVAWQARHLLQPLVVVRLLLFLLLVALALAQVRRGFDADYSTTVER